MGWFDPRLCLAWGKAITRGYLLILLHHWISWLLKTLGIFVWFTWWSNQTKIFSGVSSVSLRDIKVASDGQIRCKLSQNISLSGMDAWGWSFKPLSSSQLKPLMLLRCIWVYSIWRSVELNCLVMLYGCPVPRHISPNRSLRYSPWTHIAWKKMQVVLLFADPGPSDGCRKEFLRKKERNERKNGGRFGDRSMWRR